MLEHAKSRSGKNSTQLGVLDRKNGSQSAQGWRTRVAGVDLVGVRDEAVQKRVGDRREDDRRRRAEEEVLEDGLAETDDLAVFDRRGRAVLERG